VTVLDVIQRSAEFLGRKGVDSPRLQTELLLAHVLREPRLKLYLNFGRQLSQPDLEAVRELVRRRANHEPLQHILGAASFCGLEIQVNRHVLVPRPETELLAQRAWEYLRGLELPHPTVLDFGTGSGCIAIGLAIHCPLAQVQALDISPRALDAARDNAARNGVAGRIQFQVSDGFAALPPGSALRPPALDGGADGLDFFRRLAAEATRHLGAGGRLMVEFGDGQAGRIGEIFVQHKWIVENVEADYSGRPRIMTVRPDRV